MRPGAVRQFGSFGWTVRLLLVNQLTINTGFYMLMPYLANHLGGRLGLAAWAVGLVLGVRNLGQQGLFLVGGTLADRLGCKPLIVAGCALRTIGFLLLGFTTSLPGLLLASALTGVAGALFNPAVRAYLAHAADDRRVDAFALFNVFYQTGILLGPLVGVALLGIAFQAVCVVAAALFAGLTVLQWRSLPASRPRAPQARQPVLADWRTVLTDRAFLLFALAMVGAYVLSFQVYLGLPLEVRRVTGGELGVTVLFAVSALLTIAGQVRVTAWCRTRLRPAQAITIGVALMGVAFVPLAGTSLLGGTLPHPDPHGGAAAAIVGTAISFTPLLATAVLLGIATMITYPFEMDTIAAFGGSHLTGTYYGLYNTLAGIGITLGNLLSGAAFDTAATGAASSLPWLLLIATGTASAAGLHALDRARRLEPAPASTPAA
jgi:MFS family permease